MSNDLSLPRPGRLQACKRTRLRRERCPRERDPTPMRIDQLAEEAAEKIDQLQQNGELGVPSLKKIIKCAIKVALTEQ